MDDKIIGLVKNWFNKTERWQKDAFINLWKGADIDAVKERAYKLALKEHNVDVNSLAPDTSFPKDIINSGESTTNIALMEISDTVGVCALAPTKPLKFGLGLNIIYGENGCGKSSYVKILKKAQDPKSSVNIFGNIYTEGEKPVPSASLTFDYDGVQKKESWTSSSKKSFPIRIYDTQIAKQFVEDKNEVVYEPKLLHVFSKITTIIEWVKQQAAEQITSQIAALNVPPDIINNCNKTIEYNAIENKNDLEVFKKEIAFTTENERELEDIKIALEDSNPQNTLKILSARKKCLASVCEQLTEFSKKLDNSFVEKYKNQWKKQIDTKTAYDYFVNESRDISIFKGLGSDAWNDLWKASIEFRDCVSKIDEDNKIKSKKRCVLCQQELSDEAKKRNNVLDEFYKSTIKTEFDNADRDLKGLRESTFELIEQMDSSRIKLYLESNAIPNDISDIILGYIEKLLKRAKWIYNYNNNDKALPESVETGEINRFFEGVFHNIESQIQILEDLVDNYDSQYKKWIDLTANKWFFDNQNNLDIKAKLFALKDLCSKATTNMVTTLKKNLSQIMITETYIKRFSDELNSISSSHIIKVELIPSASKGKVYHKVALVGAVEKRNTEEILSEGEYRAVSIAAFLADLSSWNVNQAFVFDDPINSLDHIYEESIAERLVDLAKERQVIVFTHRLAFAEMLNRVASYDNKRAKEKEGKTTNINYIKLVRNPLGDPDYQNDFAKFRLDKQLNDLDGPIKQIENYQNSGDHMTADIMLKGLCSRLRDIIEKSIETTLLSNIVSRYARNISSEKIRYLKAIKETDIDFIDSMMSKYSKYDHSQSNEKPVSLPAIDEFKDDVKTIKDWYNGFKKQLKKYDIM